VSNAEMTMMLENGLTIYDVLNVGGKSAGQKFCRVLILEQESC